MFVLYFAYCHISSTDVLPQTYHSRQQHVSQYDFRCTYRVDSLFELYISYFLRTSLFWVITRRVVEFLTGVSGQPIGPIFKGQEFRRILTSSRNVGKELPRLAAAPSSWVKNPKGFLGCPETSIRNYHYLLRSNTEERSFHLIGGSLKSPFVFLILLFPLIHIFVTGTCNLVVNLYSVILSSAQEIITSQTCFGHSYILDLNISERCLMNF